MRLACLSLIALLVVAVPATASGKHKQKASAARHASARVKTTRGRASHAKATASRPIAMAPERATEIQTALIREGYLKGEPTGTWDAESAAAMQKMQSDNGWQTKIVPDSRAIIKLGLGPQRTVNN